MSNCLKADYVISSYVVLPRLYIKRLVINPRESLTLYKRPMSACFLLLTIVWRKCNKYVYDYIYIYIDNTYLLENCYLV